MKRLAQLDIIIVSTLIIIVSVYYPLNEIGFERDSILRGLLIIGAAIGITVTIYSTKLYYKVKNHKFFNQTPFKVQ
jgi:hypothetical protein